MIAAMVAKHNSLAVAVRLPDSSIETHHWGSIALDRWPAGVLRAAVGASMEAPAWMTGASPVYAVNASGHLCYTGPAAA